MCAADFDGPDVPRASGRFHFSASSSAATWNHKVAAFIFVEFAGAGDCPTRPTRRRENIYDHDPLQARPPSQFAILLQRSGAGLLCLLQVQTWIYRLTQRCAGGFFLLRPPRAVSPARARRGRQPRFGLLGWASSRFGMPSPSRSPRRQPPRSITQWPARSTHVGTW